MSSKTSIFQETFTKSDNPSFQNEHFPRDIHQKWESKLPKRAFSTRLSPQATIQASKTSIFQETFTKFDNPSFQNEHFPGDFHQIWQSKLPKRAFSTRLSPQATIQASKTSIFQETFTKFDNPSFQNEHFPRDFHQKWQSKLPKWAFSTRLVKSDNPSFPNEHFPRDWWKVTIQASKTSVLHETSHKSELRSKQSALQIPM